MFSLRVAVMSDDVCDQKMNLPHTKFYPLHPINHHLINLIRELFDELLFTVQLKHFFKILNIVLYKIIIYKTFCSSSLDDGNPHVQQTSG